MVIKDVAASMWPLGLLALSVTDCPVVGTLKQPGEEAHMGRYQVYSGPVATQLEYYLASLESRFIFVTKFLRAEEMCAVSETCL